MTRLNPKSGRNSRSRCIFVCLAAVVCLLFLPLRVSANGPVAPPWLSITLSGLPKNVLYADLLIKIDSKSPQYTPLNTQALEQFGFSPEAGIVAYHSEGFQSFTFHYANAASSIDIYRHYNGQSEPVPGSGYGHIEFAHGAVYDGVVSQYENLRKNFFTMRLAFLDAAGAVVSVSKTFELPRINHYRIFSHMSYHYGSGQVTMESFENPSGFLFYIFSGIFFAGISAALEAITAIFFFRNRDKVEVVIKVNAVSQALMRILYVAMAIAGLPYLLSIIFLEALVYTIEWRVYRNSKIMAGERNKKLLAFSAVANTVSLVVVAYLNGFSL